MSAKQHMHALMQFHTYVFSSTQALTNIPSLKQETEMKKWETKMMENAIHLCIREVYVLIVHFKMDFYCCPQTWVY